MTRSADPPVALPTVSSALRTAAQDGIDRLDAQWLLADLLAESRTWLITHGDSPLDAVQSQAWLKLLARLASGEPLAYLMGQQVFRDLTLQVGPAVLVPRSDTEALVAWATDILQARDRAAATAVVDLGCGSGAIALALKSARPSVQMTAVDLSDDAIEVAASNGARLGLSIDWCRGHWWDAVGDRRFDLAVSNPPYIAREDPHLANLRHEPMLALVSGEDGLDALREIISQAPGHLHPQSWLLLEHGHQQADAVAALLSERGFDAVQTRPDLAGRPRCTGGRWP